MYNYYFNPIADIGDKVLLMTNTGYYLVNVEWIEPVPMLKVTTDTITAGKTLTREMTELYVEDNEFAQWRMKIETSGIVLSKHTAPEAAAYYATKNATGELPDVSQYGDAAVDMWNLTEFYQFQDTTRKMTFENTTSSDTAATVDFYGYIYVFTKPTQYKDITQVPKPYRAIPTVSKIGSPKF